MIMRERIYVVNINLKIDIPNSRLIKSSYWLLAKVCILLNKVGRNSTACCMRDNCIEL